MAERKRCQGLNSKCFLVTYLVIVGFLLLLWFSRASLIQQDLREIPSQLSAYLVSPPKPVSIDITSYNKKRALTSNYYKDHWTLVYFSHKACFPACEESYKKLVDFKAAYASHDIKVLIIDLDGDELSTEPLTLELEHQGLDFEVFSTIKSEIEPYASLFEALFLETQFSDGSYQIEQQHDLFLVDPKARVYAKFNPKTSSIELIDLFNTVRQFYALSE